MCRIVAIETIVLVVSCVLFAFHLNKTTVQVITMERNQIYVFYFRNFLHVPEVTLPLISEQSYLPHPKLHNLQNLNSILSLLFFIILNCRHTYR